MAVPRLDKIVLNMGMGEAIANAKVLDAAVEELSDRRQKPVITGPRNRSPASSCDRECRSV
jgi:large subunit ribosomal protein L5